MPITAHVLENQVIPQGAEESQGRSLTHDFCLQYAYCYVGVTDLARGLVGCFSHSIYSLL